MKRHQIAGVEHTPTGVVIKCPMLEDLDGEWVRYRDVALYEALLAEYGLSYFAELADAIKQEREACARRLNWLIDELWSDLHEVDKEQLIKEAMEK